MYSIIVSGLLAAAGFAIYLLIKKHAKYKNTIAELENAIEQQSAEMQKMENIIGKLEDINDAANDKKSKLRNGDRGDNLRTATNIMRELSGSENGDETTAED